MPDELTAGIVRILNRVGSADGLIATCAHVVEAADGGPRALPALGGG
jgi:hypothetical protein